MNLNYLSILFACLFFVGGCQHNDTVQPPPDDGFNNIRDLLATERDPITGKLRSRKPPPGHGGLLRPPTPGSSGGKSTTSYRLVRGDQVMIQLQGIPQEQQLDDLVDEDGNVTVPHLNQIYVVGKTAAEVERQIQERYKSDKIYKRITVNVVIAPKSYFVRGEVKVPGRYPLPTSGVTISQGIATAGGYTDFANRKKIQLSRNEKVTPVNMEMIDLNPKKDFPLEPGDVIVIKRRVF